MTDRASGDTAVMRPPPTPGGRRSVQSPRASLGHLGLHGLCCPLRGRLADLLQKVVHLKAEGLDLLVPGGQRFPCYGRKGNTGRRKL